MKHYQPINLWAKSTPEALPEFVSQQVKFGCFHCGRETCVAVPRTYVDWEHIASDYKKMLQRFMDRMNQTMAEIELIHGTENAVTQFYRNQWAMLALEVQAHFGNAVRGTSALQRDGGEDHNEGWKQK